jgi:hypothetical protein
MAITRRQEIQLSPDGQAAFFRERKKAALATIDGDGFPHVVAEGRAAGQSIVTAPPFLARSVRRRWRCPPGGAEGSSFPARI